MKTIYVCSTVGFAGKTLTTLGIGQFLKEKGISFTYRKPVGIRPVFKDKVLVDDDALFIAEFFKLDVPPEELCPVILSQDLIVQGFKGQVDHLMTEVVSASKAAGEGVEVLLLGGYGGLYSGAFLGLSGEKIAKALEAKVVMVVRYEGEYVVDYLLKAFEDLGPELFGGVIFNDISEENLYNFRDLIQPFLGKKGLKVLGEIPHDSVLAAVSVKELREYLGAQLLGTIKEDRLVEHFLIGGMQVDKAIQYFRKAPRFGVIVGGDRSDIQLAAIETGASCLILTGGLYPNEIILSRAEEAQVPILVVHDDTYSVARRVEKLPVQTRIRHPEKLARALELTKKYLDYQGLEELVK